MHAHTASLPFLSFLPANFWVICGILFYSHLRKFDPPSDNVGLRLGVGGALKLLLLQRIILGLGSNLCFFCPQCNLTDNLVL